MESNGKPRLGDGPASSVSSGNGEPGKIEKRIQIYQRQLRRLATELSLTEARERRAIASDLHDHIGQALAYVTQKVSTLRGNTVFSGMEEDFSEILSILNQTIRYTRNLTVEISPPVLYELGLSAAVDWLADRTGHRYGLTVRSSTSGKIQEIPENISVFIFKAVQELITNAVKHARAGQININADWQDNGLEVVVSDNGRGFDTTSLNDGLADTDCFGLFSIRERLSYIGGELRIESTPGKGTRISLFTPYSVLSETRHD